MKECGFIDLKSFKAFNIATRGQYSRTLKKLTSKSNTTGTKEKRKEYSERPDVKEKRKLYNERQDVKDRKKEQQVKRSKMLKELRLKEPEIYARLYANLDIEDTKNDSKKTEKIVDKNDGELCECN